MNDEWDIVRWLLVKSNLEAFEKKHRKKINDILLQIADEEEAIIQMLFEGISSESDYPQQRLLQKKSKHRFAYHQIDLAELLNNKAFSPLTEPHADLTGLSEWFVYDDEAQKVIDLLNADFKLFINNHQELDNVTCLEQRILVLPQSYTELVILATAEFENFMTIIKVLTVNEQEFDLEFDCIRWAHPETDITEKKKSLFSRARKHPNGVIERCGDEDKGYLYEYRIPIPTTEKLKMIILPLCPNIHIFAMNLAFHEEKNEKGIVQ